MSQNPTVSHQLSEQAQLRAVMDTLIKKHTPDAGEAAPTHGLKCEPNGSDSLTKVLRCSLLRKEVHPQDRR
jgi:hypothetical protein